MFLLVWSLSPFIDFFTELPEPEPGREIPSLQPSAGADPPVGSALEDAPPGQAGASVRASGTPAVGVKVEEPSFRPQPHCSWADEDDRIDLTHLPEWADGVSTSGRGRWVTFGAQRGARCPEDGEAVSRKKLERPGKIKQPFKRYNLDGIPVFEKGNFSVWYFRFEVGLATYPEEEHYFLLLSKLGEEATQVVMDARGRGATAFGEIVRALRWHYLPGPGEEERPEARTRYARLPFDRMPRSRGWSSRTGSGRWGRGSSHTPHRSGLWCCALSWEARPART